MKPLTITIVAFTTTEFFNCLNCEVVWKGAGVKTVTKSRVETSNSSIPSDMMKTYTELSDWINRSAREYNGRVVFRIADVVSVEGFLLSLRYGIRKYPAVIIGRKKMQPRSTFQEIDASIRTLLSQET